VASTSDIRMGLVIQFKHDLYKIVEFQHVKPGKGGAFVRAKLKSIKTGRVIDNTWNAGASIEPVKMMHKRIQFLYRAGEDFHFMDNDDYDQFELPKAMIEPYIPYLLENMEMDLLVREEDNSPVDLEFPTTVILEVTEAHDAARGDTAGSVTKEVMVETGHPLHVPPFIKQGERIKIDTRTGKYLERSN